MISFSKKYIYNCEWKSQFIPLEMKIHKVTFRILADSFGKHSVFQSIAKRIPIISCSKKSLWSGSKTINNLDRSKWMHFHVENNCTLQMQHLLEIFVNYSLFIALTLWPVHCEWISTYLTRIKMKLSSELRMCCTHRALNILVYFETQKITWNNFHFDHTHRTSDCHVERLPLSPDMPRSIFCLIYNFGFGKRSNATENLLWHILLVF